MGVKNPPIHISPQDIIWKDKRHAPYRYHAILTHIPSSIQIEQASDTGLLDAKNQCLNALKWKLSLLKKELNA